MSHDCAHEDAPGLREIGGDTSLNVALYRCRECYREWWLIKGVFFADEEWELQAAIEQAEVLQR